MGLRHRRFRLRTIGLWLRVCQDQADTLMSRSNWVVSSLGLAHWTRGLGIDALGGHTMRVWYWDALARVCADCDRGCGWIDLGYNRRWCEAIPTGGRSRL